MAYSRACAERTGKKRRTPERRMAVNALFLVLK
jgi:hypothetical protein